MPLQQTSGSITTDAYGGGAASVPNYIEDVFSTYLYTGNGSTQTITNGIDLSTKGGMVWLKKRGLGSGWHQVYDTARGVNKTIFPNDTTVQLTYTNGLTVFGSAGFTIGNDSEINGNTDTQVSWTFRKQPKFFDVVTYTGGGSTPVTVSHSLGSTPGFIVTKRIDSTSDWTSWHRSSTYMLQLNRTEAASSTINNFAGFINNVGPTTFQVNAGSSANDINVNGGTYVAYLFAHNAGGFGLTGTDNVISCGSISGTNSLSNYNLGYEPQWLLIKPSSGTGDWTIYNNMSGWTASGGGLKLNPNTSGAETPFGGQSGPTATGFTFFGTTGVTYIYIAIRRGPMKTPTSGTSVFSPVTYTGTGVTNTIISANAPFDLAIIKNAGRAFSGGEVWFDRLRGPTQGFRSDLVDAEVTSAVGFDFSSFNQTGFTLGASSNWALNASTRTGIAWNFRRAPGFFDEVCYTGTGSVRTLTHNLGVAPELMIVKARGSATGGPNWVVYASSIGASNNLWLNLTNATGSFGNVYWNSTAPTSSVFSVGTNVSVNESGIAYVAYLFASCPGVSKVTNFTGNGSTQTINCGFTTGARFVLIKATSTTGNWLVFDTARGMTTSTDPWLALNSTAAESATTGACTTTSVGFTVDESKLTGVNTNGVSYIALAVA